MNRDVLKGQWMQLKGRVKEAWGDLTDDDLTRAAGDWDQLVGRIQERTGEAREAIELELDRMLTRFRQAPPAMEDAS